MAAEWTAKEFEPIAFARPLILGYCLGEEELQAALILAIAEADFAPLEYALEKTSATVTDEKTLVLLSVSMQGTMRKIRYLPEPYLAKVRSKQFHLATLAARALGTAVMPPHGYGPEAGYWKLIVVTSEDEVDFSPWVFAEEVKYGDEKKVLPEPFEPFEIGETEEEKLTLNADLLFDGHWWSFIEIHRELLARFREHRGRATWLCPPSSRPSSSPAS